MKAAALLRHRAVATQYFFCKDEDADLENGRTRLIHDELDDTVLIMPVRKCKEERSTMFLSICRLFNLVASVGVLAVLYWIALYTGIYDRDASCPVKDWTYEPRCGDALTHQNTTHLQSALTPEQWHDLRLKYQQSAREGYSSLASNWADLYKQLPAPYNDQVVPNSGYLIPIEIKTTPDKGRGVFTAVDIKKGEKIWDNRFQATFPNDCASKIFYSRLSNEQACDTMFWSYVHNFFGDGYQTILDLDGHGYTNHGSQEDGLENVVHHFDDELDESYYALWPIFARLHPGVKARRRRPGAHGLYAIRDISAGEGMSASRFWLNIAATAFLACPFSHCFSLCLSHTHTSPVFYRAVL